MPILLSISAADLDDESLQELTRQLCQDLRDEAGIESSLVEQSARPGTKGDLVTIGQILVAAIGAGGPIVALINVLKAYVLRKPSLQIKVRRKNGDTMEIKADDLRSDEMTKLVQAVKEAFEEV
jgi:Effector Associated Constant Component 1